jgi:ribonuclease HI
MVDKMKKVKLYTDGACSGNPGPGGWGAILIYEGIEKEFSGGDRQTTNNKMELTAAIEGLKKLKYKCEVELFSDSAYLINSFVQKWIYNWDNNGWRLKDGSEVKNIELWKELYRLNKIHEITWIKVKGHSDNKYNNRCDELARGEVIKD